MSNPLATFLGTPENPLESDIRCLLPFGLATNHRIGLLQLRSEPEPKTILGAIVQRLVKTYLHFGISRKML